MAAKTPRSLGVLLCMEYPQLERARAKALEVKLAKRLIKLEELRLRNLYLAEMLDDVTTAKLVLATFYLCEGGKTNRGSVMFGNSDPAIIRQFLKLLRKVFPIVESKFRCTIQCRADQDSNILEAHWAAITAIPRNQFYRVRVDRAQKDINRARPII